ncbi:amino acid permease [Yaniella flava]|uniref:Amino acid permease n=1 Tax=Yaniella flava TaxID=287930 RepID=A0ABP5FQC8_9MICC
MTSVAGPKRLIPARPPVKLRRVLGVASLTLFGLAYMVPLTIFSSLGPVAQVTDNGVAGAYIITLIVMLFTALSYGKMAQRYPVAGSAYSYSQKAFGGGTGFVTGWTLMLDYLLLPMLNYLLIGLYMATYIPAVPFWVWVIGGVGLVTILNVIGIKSVTTYNGLVVALQVIFAVVFIALTITTVSGQELPSLSVAFTGEDGTGALFTGAAILCLSFLGFDAVSTLSEEAKQPKRDIPRAIMLVTFIGGATFIILSFVSYLLIPDWRSFENIDTASAEVIAAAGGVWLSNFFAAMLIAGATGSALASQASVSRILYTMGRNGVLPRRVFGVLNKRFQTPVRATLFVSAVGLLAIVLPLDFVITIVSFGALAAFTMVNLAVIKKFYFDDKLRSGRETFKYLILPGTGFLLTIWLWTSLPGNALVIGGLWMLLGLIYLVALTKGFRVKPPRLDDESDELSTPETETVGSRESEHTAP